MERNGERLGATGIVAVEEVVFLFVGKSHQT